MGEDRSIDLDIDFSCVRSRAVLVRTGWDNRFMRDEYWHSGPFLSERCVEALVSAEPVLVGVDFCNIDDAQNPARPAHTRLLRAGILVVEHLCNLGELPRDGFSFYAVPLRILHGASCSVRAFAQLHA